MIRQWKELPEFMRKKEIYPYWQYLFQRRNRILIKRIFDFAAAMLLLVLFSIPMLIIACLIKRDSNGPVFYTQWRITAYGKKFKIHKFRTMFTQSDENSSHITLKEDSRITNIGGILRKYRLDELPQLFDILSGNMSFVGTRPEIERYVKYYQPEYFATLLLPAGITSNASIRYRDEEQYFTDADRIDTIYLDQILPQKMKWNLEDIRRFSLLREISVLIRTPVTLL